MFEDIIAGPTDTGFVSSLKTLDFAEAFGERSASYVLQFADDASFAEAQRSLTSSSLSLEKIGDLESGTSIFEIANEKIQQTN